MEVTIKKISELIEEKVLDEPLDGNHGEKHPKTSDYVKEGIPFILVPDLKDGLVDLEHCNFITKEMALTLSKGFSKTGDVLFTHKATIGKVALVDTKEYEYIILTPQITYYRIINNNILNNKYLYYYFKSDFFQKLFGLYASSGGTRAYLGITAQQKLPIIFPDISYQKKISGILSKYDNLIENNNKRIKRLEEIAEQIYKERFVRFRFPGYKNIEFVDEIPKGWEKIKMKDFGFSLDTGKRPKGGIDDSIDEGIPSLGAESIDSLGVFDYSSVKYISYEFYNTMKKGHIKDGDILLYKDGAYIGKVTKFGNNFPFEKCTVNEHVFLVRADKFEYQNYLFFTLKTKEYFNLMQNLNRNAAQPGLSTKDIDGIKLLKPDINVVNRFNKIIDPILNEIFILGKQNKKLAEQSDLLLSRLMSGKLEVK